ncbi:hemolysin-III related-domain-containing protein [Mycena pura]|uniref:Hemolysin-III related-domain-containing protein n=1 Tax=Mycena pura TaxID=153505 RepID=A0AAD6YIX3_9AGAR|nr:hemolysin-III related-domain-containing protein [Mycena pura]
MAPAADTVSLLKRTVDWAELEPWQQDNPSIRTGYRRVTNSWLLCFQSLSWWHNETVNIWSHFSGALTVVAAYILLLCSISPGDDLDLAAIPAPFVPLHLIRMSSLPSVTKSDSMFLDLFLLGALTCFLCSATYHSATCHSEKVEKFMNRVDHIGIFFLGTLNYFSTFHYAFFCAPHLRSLYIAAMTVSGTTGTYLACAPTYATPAYRRMRTYTYFACGGVAIIPFVHAMWRNGWQETSRWLLIEAACYVGGALTYAERFPECRWPGRFDLIGSSHQIFHVCTLFAVWAHYAAVVGGFRYWHVERGGVC